MQPAHLGVIALLVAAGLVVTAWWMVRTDDPGHPVGAPPAAGLVPTAPPGAAPEGAPSTATAPQPTTGAAPAADTGSVIVDVSGKVRRPGIVELPAGSRVIDAIRRAGGPLPGVNLTSLNKARLLVDAEQILVGVKPPAGVPQTVVPPAPGTEAGGSTSTGLVNINSASSTELEELPGVGPVTAEAIITFRTENGLFASVDQLLDVDGIGEATLAEIAPHATI